MEEGGVGFVAEEIAGDLGVVKQGISTLASIFTGGGKGGGGLPLRVGVTVTLPPAIENLRKLNLVRVLREHIDEFSAEEVARIQERTPVRTGALQEDATYTVGSGDTLASYFYSGDYEEAEWHRFYAPYQEGPPLGLSTYTNGPYLMLSSADPLDTGAIGDWATRTLKAALDAL